VTTLLGVLLCVVAIFLILLVLVQRGRGGGLAGALGGLGGSSAFGTRAGDQFTWITYGTAIVWILLCIAAARWGATTSSRLGGFQGPAGQDRPGVSAAADAPAKDEGTSNDGAGAAVPAEPAEKANESNNAAAPASTTETPAASTSPADSGAATPPVDTDAGSTPPAEPAPPANGK
jgi:preprotein translocase subunit SecG